MKRGIIIITMLLLASFAFTQTYTVTVNGTVTDMGGNGVPNLEVAIISDSIFLSFFYSNIVTTDSEGNFEDSFDVPDNIPAGFLWAEVQDCDGGIESDMQIWQQGQQQDLTLLLTYCDTVPDSTGYQCTVGIHQHPDGALNALPAGIGPFSFEWNTGETTEMIFPDSLGLYCVTVTDVDGCEASACHNLQGPSGQDSTCRVNIFSTYGNSGEIILDAVTAGLPPFDFSWSNGATTRYIDVTSGDTSLYCVTVTDATGCVAEDCFFYNGNGPDSLFCETFVNWDPDSSLRAHTFGMPPFTYLWSTGETTETIGPLNYGLYCVTVVDAMGCESSSCILFQSGNGGGQDTICWVGVDPHLTPAGHANLVADAHGQAPFEFLWSNGDEGSSITVSPNHPAQYCVTMTDANGCMSVGCIMVPGNPFPDSCEVYITGFPIGPDSILVTAINTGLPPFSYQWSNGATTMNTILHGSGGVCVTVTDAQGCIAVACDSFQTPDCEVYVVPSNSGGLYAATHFATAPYTYVWSTGETTAEINPTDVGMYCVTITDALGCTAMACDSFVPRSCEAYIYPSGAGLTATMHYGIPPYTYEWSTGETASQISPSSFGLYCVTITDASGCESSNCFDLQPPSVDSCHVEIFDIFLGGNEYSLQAIPFGQSPFQFEWSNGDQQSIILATSPGNYCVTVVDAAGCEAVACIDINSPDNYSISGFVYYDTLGFSLINGDAILLKVDDNGIPEPVDTIGLGNLLNTSHYDFGDQPAGDYLVYIVPSDTLYLPAYHYNAMFWDEAEVISVPYGGFNSFDVQVFLRQNRPGPGLINGNVKKAPGFGDGVDERSLNGLQGVSVLLFAEAGLEPLQQMFTNQDGDFEFPNLEYGTYRIYAEVPGRLKAYYTVTLSPAHPTKTGLQFEVSDTDVVATTGLEEIIEGQSLVVSPNPAKNYLDLSFTGKENGKVTARINNLAGQVVWTGALVSEKNTNRIRINISNLQSGLYFLNLTDGREVRALKFVKD